jgi:NAD(P)-dependent dehydrogenase (short-subunit alcohol dehydrogenase family)
VELQQVGPFLELGARRARLGTGRTSFVPGDVRQRRTAEEVIGRALKWHGNIHALVYNAAIDHTGDLIDTPIDEVRALFDVNVFGALHMLQVAAKAMVSHGTGGAIVNVSSRLTSFGVPGMVLSGTSKGALPSLTRGAAVELAPQSIRVNAVAPGMTLTPLFDAWQATQRQVRVTTAGARLKLFRVAQVLAFERAIGSQIGVL